MFKLKFKLFLMAVVFALSYMLVLTSCSNSLPPSPCVDNPSNETSNIWNGLGSLDYQIESITGCVEKRIDFAVTANKTLCSVGFQGNDSAFATNNPYKIQILQVNASGGMTLVYTGSQVMQNFAWHNLTTPVTLTPGNVYIAIVSLTNPAPSYHHSFLHYKHPTSSLIPYPRSFGSLTMIASVMSLGSPCTNNGDETLPMIKLIMY